MRKCKSKPIKCLNKAELDDGFKSSLARLEQLMQSEILGVYQPGVPVEDCTYKRLGPASEIWAQFI